MKQKVLVLKLQKGDVEVDGRRQKTMLPDGCLGVSFVFESKKAARAYFGKDVPLMDVDTQPIVKTQEAKRANSR